MNNIKFKSILNYLLKIYLNKNIIINLIAYFILLLIASFNYLLLILSNILIFLIPWSKSGRFELRDFLLSILIGNALIFYVMIYGYREILPYELILISVFYLLFFYYFYHLTITQNTNVSLANVQLFYCRL
jgi:hypothetical protein